MVTKDNWDQQEALVRLAKLVLEVTLVLLDLRVSLDQLDPSDPRVLLVMLVPLDPLDQLEAQDQQGNLELVVMLDHREAMDLLAAQAPLEQPDQLELRVQ